MPTIDISHQDLNNLVGKNLTLNQLQDDILFAKGEIDETGDTIKVDIKDTNRPDLWSTEGIAREIKSRYRPGMPEYKTGKSNVVVHVDPKMKNIRPYTTCAVVRNLKITKHVLEQMIQLQEKVAGTFGRNRKEIAIGVYDLHKIKLPIKFTTTTPNLKFIPLDFTKELTPKQIIDQHPKGKEYGHLLEGMSAYPLFIDSAGSVLSMPPIINSDHTGKVTTSTRDVFIECSGFNLNFLNTALNVLVAALADRGGTIETVDVIYGNKKITTPDLTPKKASVDPRYVNKISGLNLKDADITKLLEKSGYKILNKKIDVLYPAYRQDIMHQIDIVEDILISYGYNKITPEEPRLPTKGSADRLWNFSRHVTDIMTGAGLQEIMSYILTSNDHVFTRMNIKPTEIAEIENPMSSNWSVFRSSLIPGLLEFLSQNTHREFPQKIFEIGDTVEVNMRNETRTQNTRRLAVALSDSSFGYQNATEILDFLMSTLGTKYNLVRADHNSLIPGRSANILVHGKKLGIIGEIHPQVLNNWKLELPVIIFELNLTELFNK
ncbi:MAG: phenylalanine--tRNA ligase subunit beta [Candidatus Aenigmatarchaeota archaeon]|nr:phenylalanine--tRNA ligase subunit beta [Nanoarchaeota archaeon]